MSKPILLDLFCGAGGCAKGYQQAGFYVVGVDINPQPRYAGDEFYQADALEFVAQRGREFDVIHASPPCQAFSLATCYHGNQEVDWMTRAELSQAIPPASSDWLPVQPARMGAARFSE
jgi:DNA (cytosine-5)-methyltransferase 1